MRQYGTKRVGLFGPLVVLAILAFVLGVVYLDPGDAWTQNDGSGAAQAAAQAAVSGEEPVAQVASRLGPSAVQINVSGVQQTPYGPQEGEGVGSGVIYRSDGYIITNHHVVAGASEVDVSFADGTTERGEVVGTDPTTEIAVIRVNRDDLPAATFAEGREPLVGQMAVAVGSPSGFESTVTSGVVSGVGREVPSEYTGGQQESALVDLIQTDAAISPGNSGGALADRNGRVIGINVAYLPPSETGAVNIGFAIPSDTATSVADQLIETGEAVHPYLGVFLSDLTPEAARSFGSPADSGALVERVEGGGPAADAGIERGDIVTAAGSEEVRSSGDLLSALREYGPGDTVELTVSRDEKEIQLSVRLGERQQ
jgi:serine protease Do